LRLTAPEEMRHRLRGLSTKELVSVAARFRLGDEPRDVPTATKFVLRSVARRYEALSKEIAELDAQLSSGWWRKPPRSWSPCPASVPKTPRRC
jgi:transposase